MRGVSRTYLASYLDEFIWRNNAEYADKIVDEIARQYPPIDPLDNQVHDAVLRLDGLRIDDEGPNHRFDVAGFGKVDLPLPDYSTNETEAIDVDKYLGKFQ